MKIKLCFLYRAPNKNNIPVETGWFDDEHLEPVVNDFSKVGKIKEIIVFDELETEWSLKEYKKLKKKGAAKAQNPVIYFDGGYHKATGETGIGAVIYYEKGNEPFRLRFNHKLEGIVSNSEAEYAALYNAVGMLEQLDIRHCSCTIRGDAQGVLKQLAGEWPCYEADLNRWLDKIELKLKELHLKPSLEVITREQNKEADKLARQALENKIIHSHTKIV